MGMCTRKRRGVENTRKTRRRRKIKGWEFFLKAHPNSGKQKKRVQKQKSRKGGVYLSFFERQLAVAVGSWLSCSSLTSMEPSNAAISPASSTQTRESWPCAASLARSRRGCGQRAAARRRSSALSRIPTAACSACRTS